MTKIVHSCLLFSEAYGGVGIPCLHNLTPIIVLRFPEHPSVSTRYHPRSSLATRN